MFEISEQLKTNERTLRKTTRDLERDRLKMEREEKKLVSKQGHMNVGLQIYGGPRSLSHDFKIWPITFLGSGPIGPILFSCEKSHFNKIYSPYSNKWYM